MSPPAEPLTDELKAIGWKQEPLKTNPQLRGLLELKVLDPAMGSGHFLVAATEYLARAYRDARLREGEHRWMSMQIRSSFAANAWW